MGAKKRNKMRCNMDLSRRMRLDWNHIDLSPWLYPPHFSSCADLRTGNSFPISLHGLWADEDTRACLFWTIACHCLDLTSGFDSAMTAQFGKTIPHA
jgi:hypothetical protein